MTAGGLVFLGMCIIVGAFIIVSVRVYQVRPDLVKKILRYALVGGIGLVFSVVAVAIGLRIDSRHSESYSRSLKSVSEIWGGAVEQAPPEFSYEGYTTEQYEDKNSGQMQFRKRLISTDMGFESQKLVVKIEPSVRTKGLLKFPGYMLRFTGEYEIKNLHAARKRTFIRSGPFPASPPSNGSPHLHRGLRGWALPTSNRAASDTPSTRPSARSRRRQLLS